MRLDLDISFALMFFSNCRYYSDCVFVRFDLSLGEMSEFTDQLFLKIKESETLALANREALRKIDEETEDFKLKLKNCEKMITEGREKMVRAKYILRSKQTELALININQSAKVEQSGVLSKQIANATEAKIEKLQEITELVDKMAAETREMVGCHGLMASKEFRLEQRKLVKDKLIHLLEEVVTLHEKVLSQQDAIERRKRVIEDIDFMEKGLNESKDIKTKLEADANELMLEVNRLRRQKDDASKVKLDREVKDLQKEVSKLLQAKQAATGRVTVADIPLPVLQPSSIIAGASRMGGQESERGLERDPADLTLPAPGPQQAGDIGVTRHGNRFVFKQL